MYGGDQIVTKRACDGILIPDGTPISVPAGTPVRVVQSLGETFTLAMPWGQMVRIEARDSDVIGQTPAPLPAPAEASAAPLEDQVWQRLKSCYDPEIPVNIVDLGLIYDCSVEAPADGGDSTVHVTMTLTAPGCGMGQVLADDVKARVEALPGVARTEVELVFDPPWNQNMMTEAARLQLGMF